MVNDIYIFGYNSISHFFFITSYLYSKFKNINGADIVFSIGHFFIIYTMIYRSYNYESLALNIKKNVRLLGSFGHLCLFIAVLLNIYLFKYIKLTIFNILFLIGQLGMMYLYNAEYYLSTRHISYFYNKFLIIPSIIFILIFYINNFIKQTGTIKLGFLLVSITYILWLVYIYNTLKSKNYIVVF
tara:strand:- start:6630 stop:7184 length:555 start_codon:yes stop_codon:yes gene_type:complete